VSELIIENFSKFCFIVILYGELSSELTFENFSKVGSTVSLHCELTCELIWRITQKSALQSLYIVNRVVSRFVISFFFSLACIDFAAGELVDHGHCNTL